jgi:hypothetical protein
MFSTPILLLIFNRPNHTRTVLERIRMLRPKNLFVVADGPRKGNIEDIEKCRLTRETATTMVDWDCKLTTLFRDENLGCGAGPANGISWFFTQVEQGIILEDDCLPDLSFFNFCEMLLDRYKNNAHIMHISGNNFQDGIRRGEFSYYFSVYTHNWGWATWQDRWTRFDFQMKEYSDQSVKSASSFYKFSEDETLFWQRSFGSMVAQNKRDIWDFKWMFAVWQNKGYSILPQVNLVTNIGFDDQATHTYNMPDHITSLRARTLSKIEHPPDVALDREADVYTFRNHFDPQQKIIPRMASLSIRALRKVKSVIALPFQSQWQYLRFKKFTMIPKFTYKANLELVSKFRRVPGSVVECGTWKGGMIGGMVNILGRDKRYYLFDSFEGLPEVKEIDGPDAKAWQSDKNGASYFNNCTADEADARTAMRLSQAKYFEITKGWFNETLPDFFPPEGISILRLDGDWYDSTMDCLVNLFPKINKGGAVILDDYYTWEGCAKALHDYLSVNKLPYRIQSYKGICYIIKT